LALLGAMRIGVSDEAAITASLRKEQTQRWRSLLPAVVVGNERVAAVSVALPIRLLDEQLTWSVQLDGVARASGHMRANELLESDREELDGEPFVALTLPLPSGLEPGYYDLEVAVADTQQSAQLIVAPTQCYEPSVLAAGQRAWGVAVQLYSLRSDANWGMGDFRDLRELIDVAIPAGCAVVGVNPLHALLPANPAHISPYSPSNREFLNLLYIAVPEVAEFADCVAAQARVASPAFQTQLTTLRANVHVDYSGVAAVKFAVLKDLYTHFRARHLAKSTARAAAFREYVRACGEPLRLHAIFDALHAQLTTNGVASWGWPAWPSEYHDPHSTAVERFAREHVEEIEYFLYLQWLAEEQLHDAQRHARDAGMSIGLYGDVAVGANPGGSEIWSNQALYLREAAVGAPPDPLALKGQDWGIPPQDPAELQAQRYQPFIDLLRNNMRPVAALRLDHVMTLFRLWWVPSGFVSTEGAYVHYPLEDLIAILALESQRNRCVMIGEDLGTVPEQVRDAMERYGLYHYKVLLFEKQDDGTFKPPSAYARTALATVTTHDLPTLRGWWEQLDLKLRDDLDLYPNAAIRADAQVGRARDRVQMMQALVAVGLWRWDAAAALPPYSSALARAIHAFLGMSNAKLALVQLEDLIGMSDPVNVPGTNTEYPNWQRKLTLSTNEIFARADAQDMLLAMHRARQGQDPNR
jgi:4-alpha-glucanotransferase